LEFQARRSTGFLQRNPPENLVEPATRNKQNPPRTGKHGLPDIPKHMRQKRAGCLAGRLAVQGCLPKRWILVAWDELQLLLRTSGISSIDTTQPDRTRHSSTGNRVPGSADYTGTPRAKDCRTTRH
jgi:hypothetical protein